MTYQPKNITVEAVKLRNTTDATLELLGMGVTSIAASENGAKTLEYTSGGVTQMIEAREGDYVVIASGSIFTLSATAFKQLFGR